jgi:5-methylcytosine-specific restriction protein B
MPLTDRQQTFQDAVLHQTGIDEQQWRIVNSFGVSNRPMLIQGGLMVCNANLNAFAADHRNAVFMTLSVLPGGQEVYLALLVATEIEALRQRLAHMVELGGANPQFNDNNKNVKLYLAPDARLYLRNKSASTYGSIDEMFAATGDLQPSVLVDQIVCAVFAPTVSAYRMMLGREFVQDLVALVGQEHVHQVYPWLNTAAYTPQMCRLPLAIPLAEVEHGIESLGGFYVDNLIERFHLGINYLNAKHFVILAGISGTGKSGLAKNYSKAIHGIGEPNSSDPLFFNCAVRPDWTDPTGLLGYHDIITARYIVPPFLQAILTATANPVCPVFVCLDEMNLAHVEYYLADVLSSMESGTPLQLHTNATPLLGDNGDTIPNQLFLPPNLFITGTVNVDETTHPISDKVLDRAVTLDMSAVDVGGFLTGLAGRETALQAAIEACRATLTAVHAVLRPFNLHFGYRVTEEFVRYHHLATQVGTNAGQQVLDHLLVQKLLVKLKGDERHRPMLEGLATAVAAFEKGSQMVANLMAELNDIGSFQATR